MIDEWGLRCHKSPLPAAGEDSWRSALSLEKRVPGYQSIYLFFFIIISFLLLKILLIYLSIYLFCFILFTHFIIFKRGGHAMLVLFSNWVCRVVMLLLPYVAMLFLHVVRPAMLILLFHECYIIYACCHVGFIAFLVLYVY